MNTPSTSNGTGHELTNTAAPISRAQHLIPAVAIVLLALAVAWLSFTREPASAFLFPRLIGSVMLVLALWNFARALLGMAKVGDGLQTAAVVNFMPGLIVLLVFVLFAAKYFGFYASSTVAFFGVYSLYDPASHLAPRSWLKRAIVTLVFMAVIYGLFALLLKVQTPRGLFF